MITLNLPKPPSVNTLFSNAPGRGRVKTPAYRAWLEEAGWALLSQKPAHVTGPVCLDYLIHDSGRADLGNLEKGLTDLLVSHEIIEDDNRSIVRRITLEWSPHVVGCRVHIRPEAG